MRIKTITMRKSSGFQFSLTASVLDTPNLLNDDANTNWILKVRILEPSLLESLLSESEYDELIGR